MADIRFQFLVNGESIITAGAEGLGVFSAYFHWIKRGIDGYERARQEAPSDWKTTPEEWMKESLGIVASVTDGRFPRHATWLNRDLNIGDELTIRILGPGDCDSPIETSYNTDSDPNLQPKVY